MRWWLILGAWLALPMAAMAQTGPANVVVLDTLHQMHAEVPAYDNAALGRAMSSSTSCFEIGAPTLLEMRASASSKVDR